MSRFVFVLSCYLAFIPHIGTAADSHLPRSPPNLDLDSLFKNIPDLQALGPAFSTPRSVYEFFLAEKSPDVLAFADFFGKLGVPKKKKKRTSKSGNGDRNEPAKRGGTAVPMAGTTPRHAENGKRGRRVQKAGYVSTKRQTDSKTRTSRKMKFEVRELDVETLQLWMERLSRAELRGHVTRTGKESVSNSKNMCNSQYSCRQLMQWMIDMDDK
jgi:hypothetical protein